MSTDYYLVCGQCDCSIHVAQDGYSGWTFYSGEPDCMRELSDFLQNHKGCAGLDVMSEHKIDDLPKPLNESEWTPKHLG